MPCFRRRLLHLLPVLIDAGQKENFVAFQPVITRDDIGKNLLVGMADVRRRVRVVDGGGDEKCLRHLYSETAGRMLVGQARRLPISSIPNAVTRELLV